MTHTREALGPGLDTVQATGDSHGESLTISFGEVYLVDGGIALNIGNSEHS